MAGLNTKTGQRGVQAKSYQPKQYGGSGNYNKDAAWSEGRSPAYSADQQFSNMGRMNQMANQQRTSEGNAMKQMAGQASQQNFSYNRMQQNADIGNKGYMDGMENSRRKKAQQADYDQQSTIQKRQLNQSSQEGQADRDSRERMNAMNAQAGLMQSMMGAASGAGGGGWRWW